LVRLASEGLELEARGEGFVVDQVPEAGSVVEAGSKVILKLARTVARSPEEILPSDLSHEAR
jgi:beta-lactam-binding protein with PASTA domain